MTQQITVEVLIPFIEEKGASEAQIDAVESALADTFGISLSFEDGMAVVFNQQAVLKALEAIDNHPWKGESPVEFREHLQAEVEKTGAPYWIIGADTLPLELVNSYSGHSCAKCGHPISREEIRAGRYAYDQGSGPEAGRGFMYCSADCLERH